MPLPLPTLSVQIAFNPTNLQSLTQTWTDVTPYVRDFTTSSGRQHFLDRIESSTIRLTLDNRTGFFLNGTTNGSGSVIRTRLPIKVTATTGGTTYPVFWGLTETAEERTADQLNQDILLTATDNTKYLSLLYMNRTGFYSQYAKSANAISWYRCDTTQAIPDLIGNNPGQVTGSVQNVAGALLYDTDTAIDMTNGNSSGTNFSYLSFPTGATDIYSIDFWVIGSQLAGQNLTDTTTGASYLSVTQSGALQSLNTFSGAANPYFQNKAANVADGQWHHVGLVGYKSGSTYPLYLYLDGTYVAMGDNGIPLCASATFKQMRLGNLNGIYSGPSYAYYDEVVMSKDTGSLATIQGEINNRFKAGSLFNRVIASGDRVAEVLTLAGFGSISAGALVVPNYTVNDVAWTANSGAFFVQNLQSPVTGSTALDLIQQVTDTDVGAFFQKTDGTFEFDDQAYLYTSANNTTPSGADIWSDTSNFAITSIVGTGTTATVTLSTAYNPYTSGQVVVITGNSVSSFNGSFTITSVGTTTFTFASSTSATGTGGVATSQTTNYEPTTLQVLRDDADVWTTVKITAQNGTVQTYENTAAEPLYAYSTLTKSNVVSVTNEQALQEAIYLGNLYQSPLPRVGNVELRSETNNGANLAEMLKPYVNDQVLFNRTTNGASTAGSISSTMVIESIRHDFQADPGYWHTSFTLDPFPKRGQNLLPPTFFMLFDDPTYGTFDSTNDYL